MTNTYNEFPTLFVMVGPPGAGKSTFAGCIRRYLATDPTEPDPVVVSRDTVRTLFGDYSPSKEIEVMRAIEGTTKAHLLDGRGVVVDANHCGIDQRAQVLQWAKDLWAAYRVSVRKVLVWCPVTYEQSLERKPETDEAVIQKQHDAFVEPRTEERAHVVIVDAKNSSPLELRALPLTPFEWMDLRNEE